MRHRVAGNRINMPEPRRRAAIRNMVDGLFIWEHIQTTDARAKVARSEAERLIGIALKGHNKAWEHLSSVIADRDTAEQVLAIARRGRFNVDEDVATNEVRQTQGKYPLSDEGRRRAQERLDRMKAELLAVIRDPVEAQTALTAAREAMALELHARRQIMRSLPRETTVKKIFDEFVPRYVGRHGGYTRILKIGYRKGDASEISRVEMVQ